MDPILYHATRPFDPDLKEQLMYHATWPERWDLLCWQTEDLLVLTSKRVDVPCHLIREKWDSISWRTEDHLVIDVSLPRYTFFHWSERWDLLQRTEVQVDGPWWVARESSPPRGAPSTKGLRASSPVLAFLPSAICPHPPGSSVPCSLPVVCRL